MRSQEPELAPTCPPLPLTSAGPGSAPAAGDIVTLPAKQSLFWSPAHHSEQGNKR